MPKRKRQIAQSSLEYLLTYGWALVLIATLIGVLVFAAGGGINTNTCTTFLTLICKGIGAEGDNLVLVLQNATGQAIIITPFYDIGFDGIFGQASIVYNGTEFQFEEVKIAQGALFRVKGNNSVSSNSMNISFLETGTGFRRTLASSFSTDAEYDCLDNPNMSECTFALEFDQASVEGEETVITAAVEYYYDMPERVLEYQQEKGGLTVKAVPFTIYVMEKNPSSALLTLSALMYVEGVETLAYISVNIATSIGANTPSPTVPMGNNEFGERFKFAMFSTDSVTIAGSEHARYAPRAMVTVDKNLP